MRLGEPKREEIPVLTLKLKGINYENDERF